MNSPLRPNILIVGNPHDNPSTRSFLNKFSKLICSIVDKCYIVSGSMPVIKSNIIWIGVRSIKYRKSIKNIVYKMFTVIGWGESLIKTLIVSRNIQIAIVLVPSMLLHIALLKILRKRVVVFVAQKTSNFILLFLSRLSLALSDLIIIEAPQVINEWNIEKFRHKIVIAPLYVDTNFFRMNRPIHERDTAIGYVGTLDLRKGLDILLKVYMYLSFTGLGSTLKLYLAGFGTLERIVKKLAHQYPNIIYKGTLPTNELPNFYNSIRLFILLSRSEGLPNTILEAFACGTPVIGTEVGGIPFIVRNGFTGITVKNLSDIRSIARNILELVNNNEKLQYYSRKALEIVDKFFTYEKAIKRYEKIIDFLLRDSL